MLLPPGLPDHYVGPEDPYMLIAVFVCGLDFARTVPAVGAENWRVGFLKRLCRIRPVCRFDPFATQEIGAPRQAESQAQPVDLVRSSGVDWQ